MNNGIDAVNYCYGKTLYINQLVLCQRRANLNGTTELVLWMDKPNGRIIEETTLTPDTDSALPRNTTWR